MCAFKIQQVLEGIYVQDVVDPDQEESEDEDSVPDRTGSTLTGLWELAHSYCIRGKEKASSETSHCIGNSFLHLQCCI